MNVLIVTGGSCGIGACTARLAGSRGYSVCVNFLRNREAAEGVFSDIQRAGGEAFAVQADVGVERDVIELFDSVEQRLGKTTALVNNAALLERQMRLTDMDAGRLQRMFQPMPSAPCCARRQAPGL